jgi:hypothetical protein
VGQHDILCKLANVADVTVQNFYANTATVFWQRKGSATTMGPVAYVLRLQALHQQHYRYTPLHDYIPEGINLIADVTTRSWDLYYDVLLAYFECHFPQTLPWMLCHLRKPISSALLTKRYEPTLLFGAPKPKTSIGPCGTNFSSTTTLTHSYVAGKALSRSSKSSDIDIETDESPPQESRQNSNSLVRTTSGRPGGVLWCQERPPWKH